MGYAVYAALERRLAPGVEYSQAQFERTLTAHVAGVRDWLDLGCGHRLLSEWRGDAEAALLSGCPRVIGLDPDRQALGKHRSIRHRVAGDASALPFADASFDLVTANMVVEHLADPTVQFREVARVLRPGGRFLFHTPNARSYIVQAVRRLPLWATRLLARVLEGRDAEDVYPTHYRANTPEDIDAAAAAAGLLVERVDAIRSCAATAAVPPLAVLELLLIRQLGRESLAGYRPDLICALRKAPPVPTAPLSPPASTVAAADAVLPSARAVPRPSAALPP